VEDFNAIKNQERGLPAGKASSKQMRASKSKGDDSARRSSYAGTDAMDGDDGGGGGGGSVARRATVNGQQPRSSSAAATAGRSEEVDDSETEDDPAPAPARGSGVLPTEGCVSTEGAHDGDDEMADDDDDDDEAGEEEDEEDTAELKEAAVGMANWLLWVYNSRIGLRRSLGTDALGRRYWLMAGRFGAYQVCSATPCAWRCGRACVGSALRMEVWLSLRSLRMRACAACAPRMHACRACMRTEHACVQSPQAHAACADHCRVAAVAARP
jgi:hypothetical protein